jgi:hypothetical protein
MTLNVDTSAPIRQPKDLRDLAEAVRDAAPEDESHWIEWKSSLDLTSKAGRFAVARAILGFGNRRHERAASVAGGFAYLLVGVEPGKVSGVTPVDPADLDQSIRPYIGDHAPGWTPHYVAVDGSQVLVVVVDPPRWGDPLHALRKAYDPTEAGTIFVRGNGRTDRAGPGEVEYLVARAGAGLSGLSLTVATDPAPVRVPTLPDVAAAVDAWLAQEEITLLAPLEAPTEPRRRVLNLDELRSGDDTDSMTLADFQDLERRIGAGEEVTAEERLAYEKESKALSDLAGSVMKRVTAAALFSQPEDRTPEQYREKVAGYLREMREALFDEFARAYVHGAYGRLDIAVTNLTDRNFTGVQLIVEFPGKVSAIDVADTEPDLPARPRLFGTRRQLTGLSGVDLRHLTPVVPSMGAWSPRVEIDNSGSVKLTYPPVDLRPHQTDDEIDVVHLLVHEPAGSVITGSWSATATNSDGMVSGELLLEVADPIDASRLLPDHD